MPKPNKYIVKMIDISNRYFGKFYNERNWGSINNAKSYDESYLSHLRLERGTHELLKIEDDGNLTKVR